MTDARSNERSFALAAGILSGLGFFLLAAAEYELAYQSVTGPRAFRVYLEQEVAGLALLGVGALFFGISHSLALARRPRIELPGGPAPPAAARSAAVSVVLGATLAAGGLLYWAGLLADQTQTSGVNLPAWSYGIHWILLGTGALVWGIGATLAP